MTTLPDSISTVRASAAEILHRLLLDGHRVTGPRAELVRMLAPRTDHFSAQEVWEQADERGLRIARATVFRTIDFLVERGFLERIHTADSSLRYTTCALSHHHHMTCIACGRVEPVEAPDIEATIERIARESRFTLTGHHVELVGRCERCQNPVLSRI